MFGDVAEPRLSGLLDGVGAPDQVGIVVKDLDRSLARYAELWPGLGQWHCYTYSPETVLELEYRGSAAAYAMKIALAGRSPQVELIEPILGPNIYEDWLKNHGEGVHHLGVYVNSVSAELERLSSTEIEVAQAGFGFGLDGDGGFAYLDTVASLGVFVELIERPARRRPPERIWPVRAE